MYFIFLEKYMYFMYFIIYRIKYIKIQKKFLCQLFLIIAASLHRRSSELYNMVLVEDEVEAASCQLDLDIRYGVYATVVLRQQPTDRFATIMYFSVFYLLLKIRVFYCILFLLSRISQLWFTALR